MSAIDLCRVVMNLVAVADMALAAEPLSPEETIADLQVPAGLRVELVAAEPDVVDPVAIAFDEDGRMWVVEMRDYPTLAEGQQPVSRIRIFRQCDHLAAVQGLDFARPLRKNEEPISLCQHGGDGRGTKLAQKARRLITSKNVINLINHREKRGILLLN